MLPMAGQNVKDPLGFDFEQEITITNAARAEFERKMQEVAEIDSAFLRVFDSADGILVLEFLKKNTIESVTWSASIAQNTSLEAAVAHGYAREGQNALVRDIIARIEFAKRSLKEGREIYSHKPQGE